MIELDLDSEDEIEKLGAVGPISTSEVQLFENDREFEIDRQGLPPATKDRQQPSIIIDTQGLPSTSQKDRQETSLKFDRQESSVKEYQHTLSVEQRAVANEINIEHLNGRQTSLKNGRQTSASITDMSFKSSQELIESAALIFPSSTEPGRSQSYRQKTKDRTEMFDSGNKQRSSSFVHRNAEKEENRSPVHEKVKEKDKRKESSDTSEKNDGALSGNSLTVYSLC